VRICFLLHQGNMYSGGQGVYLAALAREYVAMGHDVHAVVGPPYPALPDAVVQHRLSSYSTFHLLEAGSSFWRRRPASYFQPLNAYELATSRAGMFSVMSAFSLRAFRAVSQAHPETPFDVVHDNQSLGYGDLFIRRLGTPVVANIHHPLSIDRANAVAQAAGLRARVGRVLFYPFHMQQVVAGRLDGIITGSEASRLSVSVAFGLPPDRIAAIADGVDVPVFRSLGLQREPGRVLFVGNSDDRNKGARYLVEALALLTDHAWRLRIVDRLDATVARARADELGIADRVELTGRLSRADLVTEYNRAAVFVSPSLYEGFGLPAAEAQACGAPVVATTGGALPEVVEDGVSGLLVPPADSRALAAAISRLLNDSAFASRLGEAGVRRVAARFTWRRTAERTLALYRRIIEERATHRQS